MVDAITALMDMSWLQALGDRRDGSLATCGAQCETAERTS